MQEDKATQETYGTHNTKQWEICLRQLGSLSTVLKHMPPTFQVQVLGGEGSSYMKLTSPALHSQLHKPRLNNTSCSIS